jgi:hypothetical protein
MTDQSSCGMVDQRDPLSKGAAMDVSIETLELDFDVDYAREEDLRVQVWREEQLQRLGLPRVVAEAFAELVDWHELAALIRRGCSPALALEIVR